jgi:hypothetical protein
MDKYLENPYGIYSLDVVDYLVQPIESDEDSEYRLLMETGEGTEQEVYCSSAYEQNLIDIKSMLEKKYNLVRDLTK